ncbi:AAA family ATPase [Synechococcus sp. J7-Johnson]|uniref:AAA family ATPase n=1 Tax=Synechococcus sp. J7-Johnson TaxID=2823737 RepID=UPI0020CDEEEB|nr:AAA family ATPase [Synechococcus sp. J7-Johnson]MCP9841274.1 AAA family ATPase [Synechococcus sp. J7-Johnson]
MPILRAEAEALDLTIRDQELQALLTAARRATTGSDQPVLPGQWLDVTPTPWLWDGLVMLGRLNLMIALPKQGKTSLLLVWIAAHHRNEPAFLDRTLHGPCPEVLVIGTDQGGND